MSIVIDYFEKGLQILQIKLMLKICSYQKIKTDKSCQN